MELGGLKTLVGHVPREPGDLKRFLQRKTKAAKLEFDPTRHLTKIQGNYFHEVKWRLVWMHSEHPNWSIEAFQ